MERGVEYRDPAAAGEDTVGVRKLGHHVGSGAVHYFDGDGMQFGIRVDARRLSASRSIASTRSPGQRRATSIAPIRFLLRRPRARPHLSSTNFVLVPVVSIGVAVFRGPVRTPRRPKQRGKHSDESSTGKQGA